MARTYKTLSLSLPPEVFDRLHAIGKATGRTGARAASVIVIREVAEASPRSETRRRSWCCAAPVIAVAGQLVLPEDRDGGRRWVPAVALLCDACKRQMHGREYEGWIVGS